MNSFTYEQLRDMAYTEATANNMIESFNYEQFQSIECTDYAWEPFENWPESDYSSHVESCAESTLRLLQRVQDELIHKQTN